CDARGSQGHARNIRARSVRTRTPDTVPPELLSLHRTQRRTRHQLRRLWRDRPRTSGCAVGLAEACRASGRRRRVCHVQADRMGRSARQRDGTSRGLRGGRLRSGALHRLRVRRRHRAARAPEMGRRRHPTLLRERSALPGAVPAVRLPYHWLRELVSVPADPEGVAATLGLRGFEVASIEQGAQPVIDFEVTANRPDCLSVIGLAREASAAYALPLTLPDRTLPPADDAKPLEVVIEDAELCPRYCAQMFEVRSLGASPAWLRDRLEAAGVRSINAIVDVTNYVMIEMGHPTHAFDLARLNGAALRIRRAKPGERIRTLDGLERALEPDMLVIA